MDDFRRIKMQKQFERSKKIYMFFTSIKKHWIIILVVISVLLVLLFPGFFGGIIGTWYNKFSSELIKSITI